MLGDPLEVSMFEVVRAQFLEPDDRRAAVADEDDSDGKEAAPVDLFTVAFTHAAPNQLSGSLSSQQSAALPREQTTAVLGVKHIFEFDPHLKRMSVIAREKLRGGGRWHVFSKGAPEAIKTLCDPATIPVDFDKVIFLKY